MKKLFLMAIAVMSLAIASCTNGQKANVENPDEAIEAVQTSTDAIAQALQNADASALQAAIEAVKAKAAELLAKNPEIADWLIEKALARRAAENGLPAPTLSALDDRAEHAANAFMCTKLGVRAR